MPLYSERVCCTGMWVIDAGRIVCSKLLYNGQMSVCLSCRLIAAATVSWFAADLEQQIGLSSVDR